MSEGMKRRGEFRGNNYYEPLLYKSLGESRRLAIVFGLFTLDRIAGRDLWEREI